ncbi:hypothetical protein SERLA73DRAFT_177639 [Serpula lacrymans var. lacrymans S7.3]|uniref:Uncharacterized protein n=2 Tax=Serpula lacrymans var. lacrymans TaxID=341189 RepID=F8PP90_SERL3|nr:uncharacterized protein SERLADRAFT_461332 [Serpula lacrymans var. lacrymans S7.9]EGO01967.1 hypothetical protein SERLA73DRAFT_177639 [Serpula lacrymans var. lacrymans S7.3]EGO27594.1 hypothetical protein SERLADRAFT_461332 [Serpula lacrymans var. lacrymans S7.9]
MSHRSIYRSVVREVHKASIKAPSSRNKDIAASFREIFDGRDKASDPKAFDYDLQNTITFMRSQRMYKELLDRYNPLFDLTAEERIEATARRVGLNMPVTVTPDSGKE